MKTDVISEPKTLEDARLVELGLGGNRDAFGELVTRYQSPVCALAYSACGNISQSEDVAQETFVIAWRKLGDLKDPAKFKSWLFGIARNLLNNTFRASARNPLTAAEPLDEGMATPGAAPNPAKQAISKEEEAILWRSLELVPETYREPLILFYREHQSIERVAEILEVTEEAARQRLSRGRKLLQEQVTAFVEGALARTNPGEAFTLGVLAALPITLASSAKAATLAAAAKGGATVTGTSVVSVVLGILTGPALGFLAGFLSWREWLKNGRTPRERSMIKRYGLTIVVGGILFFVACSLFSAYLVPRLWQHHPVLVLALGWTITMAWVVFAFGYAWWQRRVMMRLREDEQHSHPELFRNELPAETWEYRSRATLFGLPLVHWQSFGRVRKPGEKVRPAIGWIACGERAYGILYASGGIAVGGIASGGLSIGLVAFGGASIGLLAFGGLAIGALALGGGAIGYVASGGLALGWHAAWGGMVGAHDIAFGGAALGSHVNDAVAQDFYSRHAWLNFAKTGPRNIFWLLCFGPMFIQTMIYIWWRRRKVKRMATSKFTALLIALLALHVPVADAESFSERITVTVRGTGPDVVFIPGLASSSAVWDAAASKLEGHYRLHLVQVNGFGGVPARANAQGQIIQPTVDAIDAYIKTNQLKEPSIIGHSMGGLMGMMLADQHPGDVGKLMIVDALPFYSVLFGANDVAAAKSQAAAMRDSILGESQEAYASGEKDSLRMLVKSPEGRKAAITWAVASDKSVVARAMYEDMTLDFRSKLPEIKAPVRTLYPWDTSTGFPQSAVDSLYLQNFAGLPNKTLVRIDSSYHFIMLDQPDAFAREVATFLK